MTLLKKYNRLIFASVLICCNGALSAHLLNETSAQAILRDGHVEVKIMTDSDHLIAALQNQQSWLMGDIDTVMPTKLSEGEQNSFIKKKIKQATHLIVNKQPIKIDSITLDKQSNEHRFEIVIQAKHQFPKVVELSMVFPKSLGVVHLSVVKPQYKLVRPGVPIEVSF